ncbi:MAG: hypothetical protein HZB29_00575 [Nitrospinae bacterium]|nr:hypothetical protein [Nitrospinota bacterium]
MLKINGAIFFPIIALLVFSPGIGNAEKPLKPEKAAQRETIPLDESILENKRALVLAQEKIIFEEYVKHKELGTAISVSKIEGLEFDAGDQSGRVKIKLTPLPGAALTKLTEIFNKDYWDSKGKPVVFYKLFSPEAAKKGGGDDDRKSCAQSLICISVPGLRDDDGRQVFAYLKMDNGNQNIKAFADVINRIMVETPGLPGK